MKGLIRCGWLFLMIVCVACSRDNDSSGTQPVHKDVSFSQTYSVKWDLELANVTLKNVFSDRNGAIQLYSSYNQFARF